MANLKDIWQMTVPRYGLSLMAIYSDLVFPGISEISARSVRDCAKQITNHIAI